ncbi:hypothetical protein I4U23_023506 [Adineta vaga]|nr:hypothetical protein I4U23_023506 [Adineta vaga]
MANTLPSSITVIVSGGGPIGLTFAINLAMIMCKKHVKIIVYEGRWIMGKDGSMRWRTEEQGNIRRDQVVTLQDHVIQQLPVYIQKGLFVNINERVWPTSRNIPIQEVEDRLLDLIQPFVRSGQIELIPEQLNELSERLTQGNFDILVGADGSKSFVRRYCNIQVRSEGIEYACGVAYNIPANVSPSDEPLHQALNCILTTSQSRYLVNSSAGRRGYLNARLTKDEYEELRECLQRSEKRNVPINLEYYKECSHISVWSIIRQGLDFFNIRSKFVHRIVPIEVNVQHTSSVVREFRFEIKEKQESILSFTPSQSGKSNKKKFKTMLVCLVGDAAMGVHFWSGRGMNTGIKSAIALARNILCACTIDMPPHFLDLFDYEGFMTRLRACEQQGRSLRILLNPIDQCTGEAYTYDHVGHYHVYHTRELKKRLKETRQSLQQLPHWPHRSRPVSDQELEEIFNRIPCRVVAQLSLANPWPTEEIEDVEVFVEDIFPFRQDQYLPVPRLREVISSQRENDYYHYYHHHHHHRYFILWIVGDIMNKHTEKLINSIPILPKFANHSFVTNDIIHQSHGPRHILHVVNTIKEAQDWMQTPEIRKNIQRKDVRFRVITEGSLNDYQSAVDVIRTIRAEVPHAPVLIISNKHEDMRSAGEFPNVIIIDTVFELYEFFGINQAIQWDQNYRVLY